MELNIGQRPPRRRAIRILVTPLLAETNCAETIGGWEDKVKMFEPPLMTCRDSCPLDSEVDEVGMGKTRRVPEAERARRARDEGVFAREMDRMSVSRGIEAINLPSLASTDITLSSPSVSTKDGICHSEMKRSPSAIEPNTCGSEDSFPESNRDIHRSEETGEACPPKVASSRNGELSNWSSPSFADTTVLTSLMV